MEWYAEQLGYGDEKAFWGMAGLLHDIDFELYPEEHCERAPELLRNGGAEEDLVHAVVSHGYGIRWMWLRNMRWKRCCLQPMS